MSDVATAPTTTPTPEAGTPATPETQSGYMNRGISALKALQNATSETTESETTDETTDETTESETTEPSDAVPEEQEQEQEQPKRKLSDAEKRIIHQKREIRASHARIAELEAKVAELEAKDPFAGIDANDAFARAKIAGIDLEAWWEQHSQELIDGDDPGKKAERELAKLRKEIADREEKLNKERKELEQKAEIEKVENAFIADTEKSSQSCKRVIEIFGKHEFLASAREVIKEIAQEKGINPVSVSDTELIAELDKRTKMVLTKVRAILAEGEPPKSSGTPKPAVAKPKLAGKFRDAPIENEPKKLTDSDYRKRAMALLKRGK